MKTLRFKVYLDIQILFYRLASGSSELMFVLAAAKYNSD